MKTVTLPEEFVLEAHKAACSDWKKKIEKQVPELFADRYKIGDCFLYDGRMYILAHTGCDKCCLINTESGNLWSTAVKVDDLKNITKEEFKGLVGTGKYVPLFEKIAPLSNASICWHSVDCDVKSKHVGLHCEG